MGGHELGKITLEYLVKAGKNIVAVVITDTDNVWYKGVDEIAIKYNLPLLKEKDINDVKFVKKIKELEPDILVTVNFEQILKKDIISIPSLGCINTHASLLPKYRGRAPLNWAIINGEKQTGVTVHYIALGIDTGDIVAQKVIDIAENEYIEDILEKVKSIYPIIVKEAIDKVESNNVEPIIQDLSKGFYCGKRTAEDGQIDWMKPVNEIYNLVRAVSKPYPGAYTYYNNKKIIIWRIIPIKQLIVDMNNENGTILDTSNNQILVKAEGENLLITKYEIVENLYENSEIRQGGKFYFKERSHV